MEGRFFFAQTAKKLQSSFPNLYRNEGGGKTIKDLQRFGWYGIIDRVSVGGQFLKTGKTPRESAFDANLWEAYTWLSYDKAKEDNIIANQKTK